MSELVCHICGEQATHHCDSCAEHVCGDCFKKATHYRNDADDYGYKLDEGGDDICLECLE